MEKFKWSKWEFKFNIHYGWDDGTFIITPLLAIQINSNNRGVLIGWLLWVLEFEYSRTKIYN